MVSSELSAWDRYRSLASSMEPGPTSYQYRSRRAHVEKKPADHHRASHAIEGHGFQLMQQRPHDEPNYYLLFGVHRQASRAEIERGYRAYVKKIHPDTCFLDHERHWKAQKNLRLANIAIAVLRDPAQRARYDAAYKSWRERWKSGVAD